MIGRPVLRFEEKIKGKELKDIMVGDEAEEMRNMLEISYPVDKGIVQNWSDMEHLWDYTFSRMGVGAEDMKKRRILLTEPPLNPKSNREKLLQVMFDKYEFEGVNISVQAVLTLYAQGLMTGVVGISPPPPFLRVRASVRGLSCVVAVCVGLCHERRSLD
jgi:actin-related protein 2